MAQVAYKNIHKLPTAVVFNVSDAYLTNISNVKCTDTDSSSTWDVVDLPAAVVLHPVAAAAAPPAATVLAAGHPHEAAGHRQLGGLGEVRQDAPR